VKYKKLLSVGAVLFRASADGELVELTARRTPGAGFDGFPRFTMLSNSKIALIFADKNQPVALSNSQKTEPLTLNETFVKSDNYHF
jgi:hypothetical protein